jgi:hypothetical protein
MKANPGGYIAPDDVVGRDRLIEQLWRVLARQSLVLSAERRIGKTCVIRKMQLEPKPGMLTVYRDLENVHTSLEFADTVFRDVEKYLGRLQKTATRARQLLAHLKGAELGGVIKVPEIAAGHWKDLLTHTLEDLVEHQAEKVVLFWDELPHMIHNISKREGAEVAMEILDTLRAVRQTLPDLRMVFTGSIGLHNVITALKRAGYANAPTNDMATHDVPPLALDSDAPELARLLIEGEGLEVVDIPSVATVIAKNVDGVPYYIQHIVDRLALSMEKVDGALVESILTQGLTDPTDPWDFMHYRERMDTYYTAQELPFALSLLDILAATTGSLGFAAILNLLKAQIATTDDEAVREMLVLLQRDHYIIQDSKGDYRFRFLLVQRWWRLHRGVSV